MLQTCACSGAFATAALVSSISVLCDLYDIFMCGAKVRSYLAEILCLWVQEHASYLEASGGAGVFGESDAAFRQVSGGMLATID